MPSWSTVTLVFASLLFTIVVSPPSAFSQVPGEASVDLGTTDVEQGMSICNGDGSDGDFESVICGPADGSDDRQSKRSCANDEVCDSDDPFRNQHLYFDVTDSAVESSTELLIRAVVFDAPEMAGTDVTLSYNSSEALPFPSSEFFPYVVGPTGVSCSPDFGIPAGHLLRRTLTGSDEWVELSWDIANADFRNEANGCDFRLQIGEDLCAETRRKLCLDRVFVSTGPVVDPDPPSVPCANFRRGDPNADGLVDIVDPMFVLFDQFVSKRLTCDDAGDSDDNGQLDTSDAVHLLSYLFLDGAAPGVPGPVTCSSDASPDDGLGCASYDPCPDVPESTCIQDCDCGDGFLCSKDAADCDQPGVCLPVPATDPDANFRTLQTLAQLTLPAGFEANLYAMAPRGPTRIKFGPDGRLFATVSGNGGGGAVWIYEDADGDGFAEIEKRIIANLTAVLGLAFWGDDLYITHGTGGINRVTRYRDVGGDDDWVSQGDIITTGSAGGHGVNCIVLGPDDHFYVGQGSDGDVISSNQESHPFDATIFRMRPDGGEAVVFATGLRNPYGFAFDLDGRLFESENSPNHREGSHPEELNLIVENGYYGHPTQYLGGPVGTEPVTTFFHHSAPVGMVFYSGSQFPVEYHGDGFVALWGPAPHPTLSIPDHPAWDDSYVIKRIEFDGAVVTRVSDFAGEFRHPIDVANGPDGALYIADWGSTPIPYSHGSAAGDGAIYRIVSVPCLE